MSTTQALRILQLSPFNMHMQSGLWTLFLCSCALVPGTKAKCADGFEIRDGALQDVPNWGKVNGVGGGLKVSYCWDCAALCRQDEQCGSYECSHTEKLCNLNFETEPTAVKYRDYMFCSKLPSPQETGDILPNALVLQLKSGFVDVGECAGVYKRRQIAVNNKSLFVNEEKRRFIVWLATSQVWGLASTERWSDLLENGGEIQAEQFDGFHFSASSKLNDWSAFDAATAAQVALHITEATITRLGSPHPVETECVGVFRLSNRISPSGREVYVNHFGCWIGYTTSIHHWTFDYFGFNSFLSNPPGHTIGLVTNNDPDPSKGWGAHLHVDRLVSAELRFDLQPGRTHSSFALECAGRFLLDILDGGYFYYPAYINEDATCFVGIAENGWEMDRTSQLPTYRSRHAFTDENDNEYVVRSKFHGQLSNGGFDASHGWRDFEVSGFETSLPVTPTGPAGLYVTETPTPHGLSEHPVEQDCVGLFRKQAYTSPSGREVYINGAGCWIGYTTPHNGHWTMSLFGLNTFLADAPEDAGGAWENHNLDPSKGWGPRLRVDKMVSEELRFDLQPSRAHSSFALECAGRFLLEAGSPYYTYPAYINEDASCFVGIAEDGWEMDRTLQLQAYKDGHLAAARLNNDEGQFLLSEFSGQTHNNDFDVTRSWGDFTVTWG